MQERDVVSACSAFSKKSLRLINGHRALVFELFVGGIHERWILFDGGCEQDGLQMFIVAA